VFNPLAMDRVEVIDGKVLRLPALTGAGVAELLALKVPPARRDANVLENGRVRVEIAEDGRIAAMSVDGREVALAEPMAGLMTFPDLPAVWDAWDVERPTLSLGTLAGGAVEMAFEGDDARQIVTFTRSLAKQSSATIRYILEAGSTVLKVELDLDWRDPHTLLKAVFPTRYMGRNARYGAPFGSALRAQTGNSLADEARFENPASRWACVADETESDGLMVITEAKYGAGCRDGLLHISLLRSAMVTHADENVPLRDFAAYGGAFHTPDSDIGRHLIRYAIGHFRADAPRIEQPAALADALYTPVVRYTGPAIATPGLLGIDGGDSLIPAWAKPEVDHAWTLRLHETLGRRGVAHLRLAGGWTASLVDLRGERAGEAEGAIKEGSVAFGPYALVSVRISRA
jgi:alpha-mannosidase